VARFKESFLCRPRRWRRCAVLDSGIRVEVSHGSPGNDEE
jgi:hypothetical protein